MSLFRSTPAHEPRLQAVLADLGEAHHRERMAAADVAHSARCLHHRVDAITRETRERRADRDRKRAEDVRAGRVSPVTDRLRGLLEEIDRGRR